MRVALNCKNEVTADALGQLIASRGWVELRLNQVRPEACDIVITDISLLETRDIEELARHLVVVVMGPPSRKPELIKALELGATDFLLTPLDPVELCARLDVIARRGTPETDRTSKTTNSKIFDCQLDAERSGLEMPSGALLPLSHLEFEILRALSSAPGRIQSRAKLLDAVYGIGSDVSDRTIDYHICNIRRKLGQEDLDLKILTRRGQGYVLENQVSG